MVFGLLPTLRPLPLIAQPSPVEELDRLRGALGGGPRLLVKRDDALSFGFGGNKVRKLQYVVADAVAAGADTLITSGGVQSNHARVTAAAAARLGLRCVLVVNGRSQDQPTGNALLDRLLGAEVRVVDSREQRAAAVEEEARRQIAAGRRPYVIPIGASVPLGACGFVAAVAELQAQIDPPDFIVHSTSSGGTQAGLVAGCTLAGLLTRVLGISADEPAAALSETVRSILDGVGALLDVDLGDRARLDAAEVTIDDRFVGGGYGVPTSESREAIDLLARTEALFLDPTYTAKAMAGLIAAVRARTFDRHQTVLFWHTGGQVGLFA